MQSTSKNAELLESFDKYCQEHPHERFWQALRNWSGFSFIEADGKDTFYWEDSVEDLKARAVDNG